jgi:hypothetical protein
MVVDLNYPEFTLSFEPNIKLLVEEQKVNLMQDGKGTPMADFHFYRDMDVPAVIELNGKQYSVRFQTWDLEAKKPKVGLFFEIEIEDIPSAPTKPAPSESELQGNREANRAKAAEDNEIEGPNKSPG